MPGDSGSMTAKTSSGLSTTFSRRQIMQIGGGAYFKGRGMIKQAEGDTRKLLTMQKESAAGVAKDRKDAKDYAKFLKKNNEAKNPARPVKQWYEY